MTGRAILDRRMRRLMMPVYIAGGFCLLERADTEEFRWHLAIAAKLKPSDSLAGLGSTLHAHRSVVTAIACFAATPGDFELAASRAIGLGDDTDTVAAMAGALVGAFAGLSAIPPGLLAKLEDGAAKGKTHIAELARKLVERASTSNPGTASQK